MTVAATQGSRERLLVQGASVRAEVGFSISDLPVLHDVDAAGHDLPLNWTPVAGATRAELDRVTLQLGPAVRETSLGVVSASVANSVVTVEVPANRRLRALTLTGLKNDAGIQRLMVSLRDANGAYQPSYAVPSMRMSDLGPTLFAGAQLANGVLSLPDVATGRMQLAVVSGDTVGDLQVVAGTTIGSVTGVAADPPSDLSLAVIGGAPVWDFPGEMPPDSGDTEIDATSGVEAAMNAALAAGGPPSATLRLTAGRPSTVALGKLKASGTLVRAVPGVLETALSGEPVALASIPLPAAETPSEVRAGLQWRYLGFRLLSDRSDAVPPFAPMAGVVAGLTPARRTLPPAALVGERLGKVGVIGRALAAGRLTVTLVDAGQRPLAPPATVEMAASQAVGTLWVELADMPPITGPVVIEVRAEGGPFLWVADPAPRVRLAVRDPDPGSRPLLLDGVPLAAIDAVKATRRDVAWPAPAFSGRWPALASDLFLAVELFDLELRYWR